MKVTKEIGLTEFKFWSGAKQFVNCLTLEELETLEGMVEEFYPNGLTETQLNDLFWFEQDTLCEWLDLDIDEVYDR